MAIDFLVGGCNVIWLAVSLAQADPFDHFYHNDGSGWSSRPRRDKSQLNRRCLRPAISFPHKLKEVNKLITKHYDGTLANTWDGQETIWPD